MTLRANCPHCPEPQHADRVERRIVTLSAGRRQVCTQAMNDLGLLCGATGHRTAGDSGRTLLRWERSSSSDSILVMGGYQFETGGRGPFGVRRRGQPGLTPGRSGSLLEDGLGRYGGPALTARYRAPVSGDQSVERDTDEVEPGQPHQEAQWDENRQLHQQPSKSEEALMDVSAVILQICRSLQVIARQSPR